MKHILQKQLIVLQLNDKCFTQLMTQIMANRYLDFRSKHMQINEIGIGIDIRGHVIIRQTMI